MVRCANTGLTVMVDAHGRVVSQLPVWQAGVLVASLPAPGLPTLYTRLGDWPGLLVAIAVVLLALLGGRAALTVRAHDPYHAS